MMNNSEKTDIKIPPRLYDSIESKVVSLYVEQNIKEIPINPMKIAINRGYKLVPFSFLDSEIIEQIGECDAINFFNTENNQFEIYYDDSKSLERLRFTIMHEIGHIDLGHKEESNLAKKMADYYAAYALAPSPLIHVEKCENSFDLAEKFKISLECANFCFMRYENWYKYSSRNKQYELKLISLFINEN